MSDNADSQASLVLPMCVCAPETVHHFTCESQRRQARQCAQAVDYAAHVVPCLMRLRQARADAARAPHDQRWKAFVAALEASAARAQDAWAERNAHLNYFCTLQAFDNVHEEDHRDSHFCSANGRGTAAHDCLDKIDGHRHG